MISEYWAIEDIIVESCGIYFNHCWKLGDCQWIGFVELIGNHQFSHYIWCNFALKPIHCFFRIPKCCKLQHNQFNILPKLKKSEESRQHTSIAYINMIDHLKWSIQQSQSLTMILTDMPISYGYYFFK